MNNTFETIKNVYFAELDSREHIFARLQLNFAFFASFFAVIAYMSRMIDFQANTQILALFFLGVLWSIIFLFISIVMTTRSLTGFQYRVLPSGEKLLMHRDDLASYALEIENYNKKYECSEPVPDVEDELDKFTINMLAKCSTFNAKINEGRKIGIRQSLLYLMLSALPLLFSSVVFVGYDLDSSSPRKVFQIEDKNLTLKLDEINKLTLKKGINNG